MRLAVNAVGVRPGSAAIVIGNLVDGWVQAAPGDTLLVLTDGPACFRVPETVTVRPVVAGGGLPRRLWAQAVGVRRECRRWGADALLSAVTAGAVAGGVHPAGAIVYDVRHELRPEQFSARRRIARRVAYSCAFHRADALFCISDRTRNDVLARRPRLAGKSHATLLGADHAVGWKPAPTGRGRYVLAFGHLRNKNLEAVLHAFAQVDDPALTLRICGLPPADRPRVARLLADLDIADRVVLMAWVTDEEFSAIFAGAAAIVLASDFEGFGLPAVEAMLLGIPLVVSDDPALLEVCAGHAVVAADVRPATLAAAIKDALNRPSACLAAAREHARGFTWARMASQIRGSLLALGAGREEGDFGSIPPVRRRVRS